MIWIKLVRMSALGQKQTPALQKAMSALPRIATAKADPQKVMSASPPRADMCAALMSAMGHKQTFVRAVSMSAFGQEVSEGSAV